MVCVCCAKADIAYTKRVLMLQKLILLARAVNSASTLVAQCRAASVSASSSEDRVLHNKVDGTEIKDHAQLVTENSLQSTGKRCLWEQRVVDAI